MPYGAVGTGVPLAFLAGLSPTTGPGTDTMVRMTLGPLSSLAERRRVLIFNRRPGLPRGMTMADIASEHAAALRQVSGGPVDVLGVSTGGSVAQQLAADHPDVVGRLVLVSTACRLGPVARILQRRVAARVRAGAHAEALAVMGAGLVTPGRGQVAAGVVARLLRSRIVDDPHDLDDMATTIEAEDTFDLAACARPIVAPTLILAGARDRFYSVALFEQTCRLIPGSRLHVLPGRGHVTVMRDPATRRELAAFLA